MNKGDLIARVMKDTGLTKKDSTQAVDSVFSSIIESLKKGSDASFVGFGSFKISKRKAREGRNPKTGEVIKIAAMDLPRFSPGKAFKEAVNKK
ncbi:MAG: HU family DNA-binding protein [Alphaproteobacteria bacterium]|nr:MAG: HU family DNA-binding protein [Alphaproteobacteria bacterium]